MNDAGGCFLCGVADYEPAMATSGLNRRRFLSSGAFTGATFAAAFAATPARAFARKTPVRIQPPHRDGIIEASWALTYADGKLALLP